MGNVVLSDLDQTLLILISILLILLIVAVIYISCRKHTRLERRLWRDIERDFVIIGSPAHMAEIKKSESDLLCQDLLSKPVRPSISLAPFPQSPPPAYHHFRKSNDDGSLVDVKI